MAAKEYFSLQKQEPRRGCCDRGSGFCACMLFLLIALVIAALVTAFVFLIMWVADHKTIVDTACGQVEGSYCPHSGSYVFRGIPYAAAPVEELRWQAAVALKKEEGEEGGETAGGCWEGILDAKKKKDVCVHIDHTSANSTVVGSEDCLYLNVFSPSVEQKGNDSSKPVMVFIHGERAADPKYQPGPRLAKDMDMVVVTLQYRMGALGFLVLGEDDGNYGLTDQIEALKWVKDNIAGFGGNPDDVTLVGQGTGATSVLTLVASPEAKGLFVRAWAMSGAGLPSTPKGDEDLLKQNGYALTSTECEDIDCLRNKTAEDVTKIMAEKWSEEDLTNLPTTHKFPFARIILDGKILTEKLSDALGDLKGSDVPLLIGSAAQGVDAYPALGDELRAMTTAQYLEYLEKHMVVPDEVHQIYNFSSTHDAEYKLTTMINDARYVCSHDKMAAKADSTFTSPVTRYIIVGAPSSEVNAFGSPFAAKYAFRGWDLYALLGKVGFDMPVGTTDDDNSYQDTIRAMAKAFFSDEDITASSDHMLLNNVDARKLVCDYWNDNFFQYRAMY